MRILFRYVLREFLVPLGYCLVGFVGIYILFELFGSFSRIAEAKLPLGTVIAYFAGYLAPYFQYLAPAALMLATLYTMWNFCRHTEITAMRASGVSLMTIVRPLLVGAVLMAGFVCWTNEVYMPEHALWAKRLRTARFDRTDALRQGAPVYKNTQTDHSWTVQGNHDAACRHLEKVRIDIGERSIEAARADYLDGEWWLTVEDVAHRAPDALTGGIRNIASPTEELDALGLRLFPELTERPEDILMQSDGPQYASTCGKFRFLATSENLTEASRNSYRYDAWAQLFSPFACIVITLLTIPAGVSSGRQSVFSGVLGALGMFFAYYGLTIVCMVLAKTGFVPPLAAALAPLAIFFTLGAFFCRSSLGLTIRLMCAFFALFAVYVLLAIPLAGPVGLPVPMAHTLAATLPLAAAVFCFLRLRPRY